MKINEIRKLKNQIEAIIRILGKSPSLNYNKALLKDYKLLGLDPWKISEFNEGLINKRFAEIISSAILSKHKDVKDTFIDQLHVFIDRFEKHIGPINSIHIGDLAERPRAICIHIDCDITEIEKKEGKVGIRTTHLKAASAKEARKVLSELYAGEYREGDRAEILFPDGSKQVYVLKEHWVDGETGEYVIKPESFNLWGADI